MNTNIQKFKYIFSIAIMIVWVYFIPMQFGTIEKLGLNYSNKIYAVDKQKNEVLYSWETIKHNEFLDKSTSLKLPIIDLNEVPSEFIKMLINQEDKSFYKDYLGINFKGIARSFLGGSGGGSGICQQTVKNIFFTVDDKELNNIKNFNRKLTEILLTINFSRNYTKDEILKTYLNNFHVKTVHNWGTLYGLKVSSKFHFNKDLQDLNISEMAVLIKYINKPNINADKERGYLKNTEKRKLKDFELQYVENKISVLEYKKKVIEYRRNFVLNNYFKNRLIDKNDFEKEIKRDLPFIDNVDFLNSDIGLKSTRWILKKISDEKNQILEDFGLEDELGLKIYTTINVDLQKAIENVYKKENKQWINNPKTVLKINEKDSIATDYLQCGVFSVDKNTGSVNAVLEGRVDVNDYNNYCFSNRQAGSIFKIFDYYTLFEQHPEYNSKTLVPDKSLGDFSYSRSHTKNKDVTIREAISYSSNVVPYNLIYGNYISKNQLLSVASFFGVKINNIDNMGTLIGQDEVTLAKMVTIYNSISNEGSLYENYFISKITDRNGKVLFERTKNKYRKQLNVEVCKKLKECFNGVIQGKDTHEASAFFVANRIKCDKNNMDYGGKTGTTNNAANIWYIGYNPSFTMGIWQGYSLSNREQEDMSGSDCALLWTKIINKYNEK